MLTFLSCSFLFLFDLSYSNKCSFGLKTFFVSFYSCYLGSMVYLNRPFPTFCDLEFLLLYNFFREYIFYG